MNICTCVCICICMHIRAAEERGRSGQEALYPDLYNFCVAEFCGANFCGGKLLRGNVCRENLLRYQTFCYRPPQFCGLITQKLYKTG